MRYMKKKGKKEEKEANESSIVSSLREFGSGFVVGTVKQLYRDFIEALQEYAYKTQKKILDVFSMFFIMLLGLIFILVSLVFLIREYLGLSIGWSLFVLGCILIIISFVMKSRIGRKS